MRDEHDTINAIKNNDSGSSQGLTRGREQQNGSKSGGLDKSASLTLVRKSIKLKNKGMSVLQSREVSERRQVGDAESVMSDKESHRNEPWWRNVTMEEGF